MPNFTPSEKFQDNAQQTLGDAIGISNGNYNVRGNCRMDTVRVLSDKTVTFTAETVNAGGKVFFPSKSLNYHWSTNKRMKLYPYVKVGMCPLTMASVLRLRTTLGVGCAANRFVLFETRGLGGRRAIIS